MHVHQMEDERGKLFDCVYNMHLNHLSPAVIVSYHRLTVKKTLTVISKSGIDLDKLYAQEKKLYST